MLFRIEVNATDCAFTEAVNKHVTESSELFHV
jgi:hypothetical protein